MENYLAERQRSERSSHGRTYSDEEDECEEMPMASKLHERHMETNSAPSVDDVPKGKPKGKSRSFFSKLKKVGITDVKQEHSMWFQLSSVRGHYFT